jgi:ribulose-5-phosphate 4-epimerase/fuculose-1-phosphate aldolase
MNAYQEREIADNIVTACRTLGALDMTHGAVGHVSYRIPGTDSMLIKGKGPNEVGLRFTRARDIIKVDFNADLLEGPDDLQPPSESFLHIWLYKTRPEVRSVVHMHPRHPVMLAAVGEDIYHFWGGFDPSSAGLIRGGIPIYPSSRTITNDELGEEFAKCMGEKNVAIMLGHGIATASPSIEQSSVFALSIDRAARLIYDTRLLGTPMRLPESDLTAPARDPGERKGRGSAGGQEGLMANWRYYVDLAEERRGHAPPNDRDL